jgi:hypothetical protein
VDYPNGLGLTLPDIWYLKCRLLNVRHLAIIGFEEEARD